MEKFHEVIPLGRKVNAANTVNLDQFLLEFSLLKILGDPAPSDVG